MPKEWFTPAPTGNTSATSDALAAERTFFAQQCAALGARSRTIKPTRKPFTGIVWRNTHETF